MVEAFGSEMDLVLVCDTPKREHHHEHQIYLEKMAKQVTAEIGAKHPGTSIKPIVLEGYVATQIVEYSNKNDVSLIVMATHGHSGIGAWALGSVTHKILHAMDTPVLLVRAGFHIPDVGRGDLFKHILVPLDGSEAGEAAITYVTELSRKLASEVILCKVVAPGSHVHTIGGLDYVYFNEDEMDKFSERSAEYLAGVATRMKDTKVTVRSETRIGNPAEEIIKLADEIGTCLVAMSTHGRSGIKQWALGSVTDKVIYAGKTPVLVVRARHTHN
jgi:nucleotide-binding universal stress UspA family protein